jgi:hypothetical protein
MEYSKSRRASVCVEPCITIDADLGRDIAKEPCRETYLRFEDARSEYHRRRLRIDARRLGRERHIRENEDTA